MTIDTLEYVERLEAAGVDRKQAEAHAKAARELVSGSAATKLDLEALGHRLELRIGALEGRVTLLTWMVGFNLAATMAVLWKLLR
jgi:hypothetical protein